MKKSFLIWPSLAVLALFGLTACSSPLKTAFAPSDNEPAAVPERLIGGDQDEHGCLGPAGYSWCEAKQKCLRLFEEFCPDQAADLAADLGSAVGLTLVPAGEARFNWTVNYEAAKTASEEISGVAYEADGATSEQALAGETYLNSLAAPDQYNQADGPEGALRGYQIDYQACLYNFRRPAGSGEGDGAKLSIRLECGFFNPNSVDRIAVEEAARDFFRQTSKSAPADIKISVTAQTDSHARGSATFLDDSGQAVAGAYFFARRLDGRWQIILHGNGQIDCRTLADNDFPAEMSEDCVGE